MATWSIFILFLSVLLFSFRAVGLLSIVGLPLAVSEFKVPEAGGKLRLFRTGGVNTESDASCSFRHVTDPHL